ncbi:hypothetical protein [Legionella hackeliae]|uniref:Uncharacterized protein n=1 Tax=Legionella hackeliae TaxID=449 RepID=A0A0A8UR36_LEGHA|nr:hypothetical protein [Legionella hackeliae]KTD15297.1 putative teichoic acid biosynthesis protein [Legionella hackeliae]CEK11335.1 protein of unknown function [Legionella hackeliae]STX48107.1 putative teichoic acid biosynthesis protein [Legionella hackeliae]
MKLLSSTGYHVYIYTDEDPPSPTEGLTIPSKKPYIILRSSLIDSSSKLANLGYFKRNILTITSPRKVAAALQLICSDNIYADTANTQVLTTLKSLQEKLESSIPKKPIPPKSKDIRNYVTLNTPLSRHPNAPQSSHAVTKVQKINTSTVSILKKGPSRRILEIEAFNGFCYRLLLNKRVPKVRSVHDGQGYGLGVLATEIPNFKSLHDYYLEHKDPLTGLQSPPQRDLVKAGIGGVLAACYAEEENDLHGGNVWFDPINLKSGKIDHDQATWPLTAKYVDYDPQQKIDVYGHRAYGVKPVDSFPITQRDITSFPHLKDAKPCAFSDETDCQLLDLKDIENDETFIKDAYSMFLQRILIDKDVYRKIGEATIGSAKLRQQLVDHKARRTELLKAELLKNPKFFAFYVNNPGLKTDIISEFQEYNKDYKNETNPLRLDLEQIANKFDVIHKELLQHWESELLSIVQKTYAPDSYSLFEDHNEISAKRKKTVIDQIIKRFDTTQTQAEKIFNWASKQQWFTNLAADIDPNQSREVRAQQILDDLIKDIKHLDGKLGIFGGKYREVDGKKIKLANGAAAILDLCMRKTTPTLSAFETLESVVYQAIASNAYKGHTLFNRRQKETSAFYTKILDLCKNDAAGAVNSVLSF